MTAEPAHQAPAPVSRGGADVPRPYKGADFYRVQDRHLFYGRDADAGELVDLILRSQISLLHAPSGAGKTSLLNALIIPTLEEQGWISVLARPFNDPSSSLIERTLFRVLPEPRIEAEAIQLAIAALEPVIDDPGALTLRDLREDLNTKVPKSSEGYLKARSAQSCRLVTGDDRELETEDAASFVSRFLTSKQSPTLLARHMDALARYAQVDDWIMPDATKLQWRLASTKASELLEFFDRDDVRQAHQLQINHLTDREYSLPAFFDRLCGWWGTVFEEFALVLVLDQFEELFTRFVDQRHLGKARDPSLPDWRLRRPYFEAIGSLIRTPEQGVRLPIKIVIAMRDDYIAEIDQLEAQAKLIQRPARFHLDLLHLSDCKDVIVKPAEVFGFSYDKNVLDQILKELPTEDDWVEPGHVQIVCDRLYDHLLELSKEALKDGAPPITKIDATHLKSLKQISGILNRHFGLFLEGFEEQKDRLEILDLLEPLMTVGGKRNIVDRDELICKPFRRPDIRLALLKRMADARIIRVEKRLSGTFAEVTHEFLIESIRSAIQRAFVSEATWRDLRSALLKLERVERVGFRGKSAESLGQQEYAALWWYRDRLHTARPDDAAMAELDQEGKLHARLAKPWLPECMLRNAAALGRPGKEIAVWAQLMTEARVELSGEEILEGLEARASRHGWLDHLELEVLTGETPGAPLTEDLARFVVASAIANGDFGLTQNVTRWTLENFHAG